MERLTNGWLERLQRDAFTITRAEASSMARELLNLYREIEQVSADRYTEQRGREAAEARVAELEHQAVVAQDVQEIPSPPRRQERDALLSIVRGSCEVDTVRKAALALLGEEVSRG